MRGDEFLPVGDWATRDSLAEVTEIYERPETPEGSAPLQLPPQVVAAPQVAQPAWPTHPSGVVIAPIAYVPMQRYDIPTLAPYVTGSSPQVRISERLDATHRVERTSSWQRMALVAGIVGAIATGVAVGIVVSLGGTQLEAAPAAAQRVTQGPTVTPIEVPKPAPRVVVPVPAVVSTPLAAPAQAPPVAVHDSAPQRVVHRQARHEHAAPAAPMVAPAIATGTLRIASKPPCSIAIDGKPSGKMTPQAALALPVGSHQITLTNEEQGIQLTTEIAIKADKSTSVVQDFTK